MDNDMDNDSKQPDKQGRTIGLDFDQTLAQYDHWRGADNVGPPVPEMVEKVKQAMEQGDRFIIFTARANPGDGSYQSCLEATQGYLAISQWCQEVFGMLLPITHEKSKHFDEFWDDRGRQVIPNTGIFLAELAEATNANR